jgi:hypothetical protein
MVLTQMTLALCLSMASGTLSVLLGAFGRKRFSNVTIISILVFCVLLPLITHSCYLGLETYVTVLDWPLEASSFLGLWNPLTAILIASWIGGFLGIVSGKYWEQNDRSCLQCLLGPFIILFLVSIVILFLP